jgi:hypothetical protein
VFTAGEPLLLRREHGGITTYDQCQVCESSPQATRVVTVFGEAVTLAPPYDADLFRPEPTGARAEAEVLPVTPPWGSEIVMRVAARAASPTDLSALVREALHEGLSADTVVDVAPIHRVLSPRRVDVWDGPAEDGGTRLAEGVLEWLADRIPGGACRTPSPGWVAVFDRGRTQPVSLAQSAAREAI